MTHQAQSFPEIIIQKDREIVAHNSLSSEAVYSVMATTEHNGNYTCKVEASRISKVSSVVVNITGRVAGGRRHVAGSRGVCAGIATGQ